MLPHSGDPTRPTRRQRRPRWPLLTSTADEPQAYPFLVAAVKDKVRPPRKKCHDGLGA
jgi:hypothetical protein